MGQGISAQLCAFGSLLESDQGFLSKSEEGKERAKQMWMQMEKEKKRRLSKLFHEEKPRGRENRVKNNTVAWSGQRYQRPRKNICASVLPRGK